MPGRRVVITGMAALTALGKDLKTFFEALCAGRSGIGMIDRFDTQKFRTKFGGQIKNFDPLPYLEVKEQRRLDRFAQFAVFAAESAVADAGIDFSKEDPYRCGVVVGSGVGGLDQFEEAHQRLLDGPARLSPLMIPRMLINSASGTLSIRFGLRGMSLAVATACASSNNAIGDALHAIQYGNADVMVTGGSEAAITPLCVGGFNAMRALSERNDDPERASRPFAKDRDGFVLSEGAGIVVLEEYEHARQRGARVYAELLGYGATSDGLHIAAPDPEGKHSAWAMKLALQDARLAAEQLDYVNAHATGTPLGDKAETLALKGVFGPAAHDFAISSTKGQLGHLLGASGGVEFVIATLALYHGVVPPTINLHQPDPDCDLDYVPHTAREMRLRYAMSNSFGFGGHNACLVLGALDRQPVRARMAA